jgi:GDP-L-fucose synthase
VTKIFVAGHNGMVGSAICRQLQDQDFEVTTALRKELDLTNQAQVQEFFYAHKFDQVYLAAAMVGGIHANNTYPAEFIYQNLMIQNNVIHSAYKSGVAKLLFLGSSCIYPKLAKQPINESELLNGYLEPTNEPYAIAKIAGLKMCESYNRQYGVDYRSVMPTNLYGPGDNYHPENSHVIPALIRKMHEGKIENKSEVIVWGSGQALREFLYVDDMASASIHVMNLDKGVYDENVKSQLSHINVGYGEDCTIADLAKAVAGAIGFKGKIVQDRTKPDGAPRKLMESSLLRSLGWMPRYALSEGLSLAYQDFIKTEDHNDEYLIDQ